MYRYECKVMYAEPDSLCESGHTVSYVHRGESVQKPVQKTGQTKLDSSSTSVSVWEICMPGSGYTGR